MVHISRIFSAFMLLVTLHIMVKAVADDDIVIDFVVSLKQSTRCQEIIAPYGFSSPLIKISNSSYCFYTALNTKQYLINYGETTYPSYHYAGRLFSPSLLKTQSVIDHNLTRSLINIATHLQYPLYKSDTGLALSRKLPGTQVMTYINSNVFDITKTTIIDNVRLLMIYAYLLFHEGCPLISSADCFHNTGTLADELELSDTGKEIIRLIDHRKKYIQGDTDILTSHGYPFPSSNTEYLYIARRGGNYCDGRKTQLTGAIFVLNTHKNKSLSLWVTTGGEIYEPWRNMYLIDLCTPDKMASFVRSDGRVKLTAPPEGYAIYIPQNACYKNEENDSSVSPLPSPKDKSLLEPSVQDKKNNTKRVSFSICTEASNSGCRLDNRL